MAKIIRILDPRFINHSENFYSSKSNKYSSAFSLKLIITRIDVHFIIYSQLFII